MTTGDDADSSKPDGDLVAISLGSTDPQAAVVVGDAEWDVRAAHDVGARCLALLTGGVSEAELRSAGADDVLADPAAVVRRLGETGGLL